MEIIIPNREHERVISQLESNPNGISLLPDGSIPDLKDGFIVSTTNNVTKEITPEIIKKILLQMKINPITTMIGSWFSERSNKFFVDASTIIRNLEDARNFARFYNQESIYDIANNNSIYINERRCGR
tara:strand:+ start:639 stop:1022 length:384 start_codon:yes stop_codon:yes gene_type:complete